MRASRNVAGPNRWAARRGGVGDRNGLCAGSISRPGATARSGSLRLIQRLTDAATQSGGSRRDRGAENHPLMHEPNTVPLSWRHRAVTRINSCIYLAPANPPSFGFLLNRTFG